MNKKENNSHDFRVFDESDFEDAKKSLDNLFKKIRRLEIVKTILCFVDLALFVAFSAVSMAFVHSGQDTNGIIMEMNSIVFLMLCLHFSK